MHGPSNRVLLVQDAGCCEVDEDGMVAPAMMGRVASFYYLKHQTMGHLTRSLRPAMPAQEVRRWGCVRRSARSLLPSSWVPV